MNSQAFSKIWIIIAILIIGGVLIWQDFEEGEMEKEEVSEVEITELPKEEEAAKLTLEALKNAEYYFALYDKRASLIDGQYGEEEIVDEGGFPYLFSAGMVSDKVTFGDLNNDGKEDAALILYSTGGGSGLFYELAVVINENGNPYHLTLKYLGDRVRINSIAVKEGVIILDMIIHDMGDAVCCPTLYKVFQYKLSEDELLEI